MDIDFNKYAINNISVEYLHLNKNQKIKLISKLILNGYSYNGFGLDHNNIDWLFTKKNLNGTIIFPEYFHMFIEYITKD